MTYSPNLPIGSGWKSTLQLAFQTLRRIKFIIESDFSFGDFDPQVNFNGMTVTNYDLRRARYLRIGNLFFFSLSFVANLAAPFSTEISCTIPYTAASDGNQGGGRYGANGAVPEASAWFIRSDTNLLTIIRASYAAYTAGFFEVVSNGFIEIK